jgi:hypothetical protein
MAGKALRRLRRPDAGRRGHPAVWGDGGFWESDVQGEVRVAARPELTLGLAGFAH